MASPHEKLAESLELILNTSSAKIGDFLGLGRHGWSKGLILLNPNFCSPENAMNIWCGKYAFERKYDLHLTIKGVIDMVTDTT